MININADMVNSNMVSDEPGESKINNIVKEEEKVSLLLNNVELSHKLQKIPGLTLKHVVTNQSLYVA